MTRHTTRRSRRHQLMRAGATASLIVLALVAIAACSGYASSVPPAASLSQAGSVPVAPTNGSTAVEARDFAFNPATLTVPSGSKVTWTNNDTTAHTVTFDDASSDSGPLDPLSTFDHTFATAGTFSYHCSIHSFMHGTVTVTP